MTDSPRPVLNTGDTIAALATPPGAGGLAVIRLSGPGAYEVAQKIFTPKNRQKILRQCAGYTAHYGFFHDENVLIDDGIALCFHAPHSYTGEEMLELSCHGGLSVSRDLLAACMKAGAAPAGPGEYTRRAVLNGRLSLTQAEAVAELIGATSRQAVAAARAALNGALHREIESIKKTLVELAAHLAAWTDYPEEDVEEVDLPAYIHTMTEEKTRLDSLIDGYRRGAMVRAGVRAVIAGSPNVGKSTIFNLLSGFERAIVTPVAGTTRDVLREEIQLGELVLQLADTAGLHAAGDPIEKEGILRARQEMENAQLLLAVFDGSQPLNEEQLAFAQSCSGRPALALVNKSDLGLAFQPAELSGFFDTIIVVSAIEKKTEKIIENAVEKLLGLENFDAGAAALANQRQLSAAVCAQEALAQSLSALAAGLGLDAAGVCLDDAIRALALLTGEDATEAVLGEVFARFCVGK